MSLENASMYVCVCVCMPEIAKEICIALIPSNTRSRVVSGKPNGMERCLPCELQNCRQLSAEHRSYRAERPVLALRVCYEKFSPVFSQLVSADRRLCPEHCDISIWCHVLYQGLELETW